MNKAAWGAAALALGGFAALIWLERRRPLRPSREPRNRHDSRNLVFAAAAALTVRALEKPLVEPLADWTARRRVGLLHAVALPGWLRTAAALALLDYTLYGWHVLLHRAPLLWRFHLPHHADLDLTATTALRFHFGELALSAPWRAAQVLLLGIDRRRLNLWQQATLASILFHHSNLRLPPALDRAIAWAIMTPRLHGIHHSTVREETDSNWSSGLTLWDRLHGTLRRDVPQAAIAIGVPAYRDPRELSAPRAFALPFRRQRDAWTPLASARETARTAAPPPNPPPRFVRERA